MGLKSRGYAVKHSRAADQVDKWSQKKRTAQCGYYCKIHLCNRGQKVKNRCRVVSTVEK